MPSFLSKLQMCEFIVLMNTALGEQDLTSSIILIFYIYFFTRRLHFLRVFLNDQISQKRTSVRNLFAMCIISFDYKL